MFSAVESGHGKVRRQLARGVVHHRHQIQPRAAPFQPVVVGRIPLHEFAPATPSPPPHMHLLQLGPARLPQPLAAHPLPQRLAVDHDLMLARQHLARQRRPVIVVALADQSQRSPPQLVVVRAVRGPASQPMRQPAIALFAESLHQLTDPTGAQLQLLCRRCLRQLPLLDLPQNNQPVPLHFAQCHDFVHPLASLARRGSFYFAL